MYKKILVPLDGSQLAECVLAHAANITTGSKVEEVTLMRVVEPVYIPSSAEWAPSPEQIAQAETQNVKEAEDYLAQVVHHLENNATKVKTEVIKGRAAESIADYAKNNQIDLIIIATHGRSGVSRWVWGSVADKILRASSIPVLVVRPPGCVPGI